MRFDLCDKWLLECGGHSVSVSIPATNASALLAAGAIPDPYVGTNEKKALWLGDADTVMRTTFVLSEDEAALKAELVAEYVDTVFEAKLNGRSIGRGGNAFIPHRFDVTGLLSAGENTLEFSIRAPKKYARAESGRINGKRLPGITDVTFIRKPQCHFGWDWGLDLPVSGILVWQDFMFACRAYPFFDDEFEANARSEVGYNATRLKSHPSLALWCGNNEIEAMYSNYMMYPKYVDAQRRFFYETLPRELEKYDDLTPYIPGSPIGADFLKGVQADNVGDTHLWAVWHGLQDITYYRTRETRFCSEFGFESFPDIRTIRQYAGEKQMSLYSETMRAHQKCALGNEKTYYYMTKLFGDPKTFSDTVYLSQLAQALSVSDAVSAWRRSGVTSGAMYWQFNDCWPVASWSSVDYFGRYKALQYSARRFNAPFAVTAEEEKGGYAIYAVNDYTETKKGEIAFTISDFYGKIISEKRFPVEIEGGGRKECAFVPFECGKRAARRLYFAAVLTDEKGKTLSRFSRPMSGDKKASLPVPKYDVKVSRSDGYTEIAVTSDVYSRLSLIHI